MTDLRPIVVQCIACGYCAPPSMLDEGRDEDGPYWMCMNRAECLQRVRLALKGQPDIAGEVARLCLRVDELEREVRRLRARSATYN